MRSKDIIKRSLSMVKHLKWSIILAQMFMVTALFFSLMTPLILGAIFDEQYPVAILIGLLLGSSVICAILNYFKTCRVEQVSNKVAITLRKTVFETLQNIPQSFFNSRSTGDLISTVTNDINMFKDVLSSGLLYLAEMLISFTTVIFIMILIDPILTLILAIVLPLIYVVSKVIGKPAESISKQTQEKLSDLTDIFNQSISGIDVIKTYSLQKISRDIYSESNRLWYHNISTLVSIKAKNGFFISILNAVQLIAIIGVGAIRVQSGALTFGELTSFILYTQALAAPVSMISTIYVDVVAAFAAMKRVFVILDTNQENTTPHNTELEVVQGEVTFEEITFGYHPTSDNEKLILKNFSIKAKAGEHIALVGESGAGKSTILNLMIGFYMPQKGRILIDGVDISTCSLASLRKNISVVSQNPYIFDMSIKNNILCGKPDATDEEIFSAATLAGAHDFITNLTDGYDTNVGERGASLSGGQRQRIAIARAFLKNAPILLLDEATSALDNITEVIIKKAVATLMKGRTSIIVAHRLSTIMDSDQIYVIDKGTVLAQGNHHELLLSCEDYANMYRVHNSTTQLG